MGSGGTKHSGGRTLQLLAPDAVTGQTLPFGSDRVGVDPLDLANEVVADRLKLVTPMGSGPVLSGMGTNADGGAGMWFRQLRAESVGTSIAEVDP